MGKKIISSVEFALKASTKCLLIIFAFTYMLLATPYYSFPTSFYGVYHSEDLQLVTNNPAILGKFDRGSVMLEYSSFSLYQHNFALGGNFPLSEDIAVGVAFNYLNEDFEDVPIWFPEDGAINVDIKENHYMLTSAVSWTNLINASLGVSGIITVNNNYFEEGNRFTDLNVGLLVEWPILQTFNFGTIKLFEKDFQFELTPGIEYTKRSIIQSPSNENRFSYYAKAELMCLKNGRNIVGISYSPDLYYGGLQIDLFDLISYRDNQFFGLGVSEIELGISQLLYDVLKVFNLDDNKINYLNKIGISASYADIYPIAYVDYINDSIGDFPAGNYSIKVKWKF